MKKINCPIASATLSSALAEVPNGAPYAVLHSQDIGDLEAHGSCHIAFGGTTEDGGPVPYRQRVPIGEALVAALEDQGLNVQWDGDPSQRVRVCEAQDVEA